MAQTVKNLPAIQEIWVRSLGQEDPLEKAIATYSSNFAWRIPWTEEPGGLQSLGLQRVRHDLAINIFTFTLNQTVERILAQDAQDIKKKPSVITQ